MITKLTSLRPSSRNLIYGYLGVCLIVGVITPSIATGSVPGVPHVSVDKTAYHTLVPPGALITASMCQPGSAFCLAAVGKPLLYPYGSAQTYASDLYGNLYVADSGNQILIKIAPSGQITYLAGEYSVGSATYPPVTQASALTVLNYPINPVVDSSGDLYFVTGLYAANRVVMKIDSRGVAHRLTAPSSLATPVPVEGALASSQYVAPASLSLSATGDLYIADENTCTVRVLSAKNGTLDTKYGVLGAACSYSAPTNGQKVSSANFYSTGIALAADGTIYSFRSDTLYSVTTDGMAHILAACRGCIAGESVTAYSGPASAASIGSPRLSPTVDAAGNVYFYSQGFTLSQSGDRPYGFYAYLVEVTKGSKDLPSQVLLLTSGEGTLDYANLNGEGTPSNLIRILYPNIALDPTGRIILTSLSSPSLTSDYAGYGVAYLDRNGAGVMSASLPSQTFTLTNSGSAPLMSVNVAHTGVPFYVSPTAAELKAVGYSGPAPFNLNLSSGTCLPLFAHSGLVTLQPGESCTIVVDYKPNASLPAAGSLTLQTNDPRGPLTIDLSVSTVTPVEQTLQQNTELYYGLDISSTLLTLSSPVSSNGSFSVTSTVSSSLFSPGEFPASPFLDKFPVVPSGRVLAAVTNNATGAVIVSPVYTLDADGKATFRFTDLVPGSYSLEGAYLGDGRSVPSYSIVNTLTVTTH